MLPPTPLPLSLSSPTTSLSPPSPLTLLLSVSLSLLFHSLVLVYARCFSLGWFHPIETYFCIVITGSRANRRLDLRGFGSSTYLSVPSPTSSRLVSLSLSLSLALLLEGGRRFCERGNPFFLIDRFPQQGTGTCAFFFFFFFFFSFLVSSIRKEFLFVGSEALEIPWIDRSPRDSAPIRALFRGFSEALDLPDA